MNEETTPPTEATPLEAEEVTEATAEGATSAESLQKLYTAYALAYSVLTAEPTTPEANERIERKTEAPRLEDLNGIPKDGLTIYRYPDKEGAISAGRRLHNYANRYLRPSGECVRFIKEQSLVEGWLLFVFRLPIPA